MGASAGFGHNGNTRGRGGVTVFTYTLQKNTEYVFKLGTTVSPPTSLGYGGAGAFFYEKGRLLVACGGGGASGWYGGSGGDGGGAGVAGSSGTGSSGGDGGQSVSAVNFKSGVVAPETVMFVVIVSPPAPSSAEV